MNIRIISGGQTGVDQAALRAAKALGIKTGGWAPKGWVTEVGPAPWLADEFGLKECPDPGYPARTAMNARNSDVTVWLGPTGSRGFLATRRYVKPGDFNVVSLDDGGKGLKAVIAGWPYWDLVVNVAGNRESSAPGISAQAEAYMLETLGPIMASIREQIARMKRKEGGLR